MIIDLGFLSLRISRKSRQKGASLVDVKLVNDDHVSFLKRASALEMDQNLEDLTVKNDIGCVKRAQKILKQEGIVIVPEFLGSDVIEKFEGVISSLNDEISDFFESDLRVKEVDKFLFQKGKEKLSGYGELASYPKTVVQIREGQDQGMVDVFNVDLAFPELSSLRISYQSEFVKEMLSDGKSVDFRNLNFYINSDITKTRGFHADSFSPQLKAFVYLTDCLSLDDGPYTYVRKSHTDGPYRRLNQDLCVNLPNKTETPLLDRDRIVPVLGKKGTLVISDQSGFHRGYPQSPGHKRVISVMNLK